MFAEPEKLDFTAWVPILEALAKPARHPRFYELTPHGEWNEWNPCPQLSDEEPTTVKQPQWTQVFKPVNDTETYELELFPGGLHREPLEDRCIRLLDMQNAQFKGNVLQGLRLVTVPLTDAPSFDALSYCWGDMRLCTGILFDTGIGPDLVERMYRVTEDLATCLVSILTTRTLKDKPRYLWIDQICINQEDISERNQQVPLMTEIYKTARQVLVWLGQRSDFNFENAELPDSPAADTDINGQSLLSWVLEKSVFARLWFFRLWTFQEVVLAKRIRVLVGEECQPWESLVEQARNMDRPGIVTRTILEMNQLTRKLNWLIVGTIRHCRDLMAQAGLIELQTWLPLIVGTQQCRNPRDKIYGLIGLDYTDPESGRRKDQSTAQGVGSDYTKLSSRLIIKGLNLLRKRRPDVSFHIKQLPANFVDYRKPVETVFRDFARLMVESRRSLKFLTLYEHDTTVWFPQFLSSSNNSSPGLIGSTKNLGQFAACAGRMHVPLSPTDDRGLDVKGRLVTKVAIDIAGMPYSVKKFYNNPADALDLQELCHRCWTHLAHNYGKSADDDWAAKFGREMIDTVFCHESDFHGTAPVELDGRSATEVYFMICAAFRLTTKFKYMKEAEIEITDHDMQVLRIQLMKRAMGFLGRRLVILGTGSLALVQYGVREGDRVAILHGLNVPCVIRKVGDGNKWQWLGDAFILGLMRGEAVLWEEDNADTFTLV